jgi:hypothetical protein
VLDSPASNIDGFLPEDTELLPFISMELCCAKVTFLILENPEE